MKRMSKNLKDRDREIKRNKLRDRTLKRGINRTKKKKECRE